MRPTTAWNVATTSLGSAADFLPYIDPRTDSLWMHGTSGKAAIGVAQRFSTTGPNRIEDAARSWRGWVADNGLEHAHILAFGAFSFSPGSHRPSTLTVPRIVIEWDADHATITTITPPGERPAELSPRALHPSTPIVLTADDEERSRFLSAVESAKREIAQGKYQKVVLARHLTAQVPADFDARPAIAALAADYPTCWVYLHEGVFGASPEILVDLHDHVARSRTLAGTIRRGPTPTADDRQRDTLLTSAKDLGEHALAAGSVVAAIQRLGAQPQAHGPFALELPNVWHLATDVTATMAPGINALDLAAALHPTAAVCGTPTATAAAAIDDLEQVDRGNFAGPVGWVDAQGDGEFAIALRGAQLRGTVLTASAGCGIVAASQAEQELAETDLKLEPISAALSAARPR